MRANIRTLAARTGHFAWLAGALLFMAVNDDGGCGGDLPQDGGEAECNIASDCQGEPHVDCVGDWTCAQGACEWRCDGQSECQADSDCREGERCRDGACVEIPDEPRGCYGDQDCRDGQHCNAPDICLPPPGCENGEACPAVCYGYCEDGGSNTCSSDGDCREGYYCGCAPWAADPAGLIACDLQCLPKEQGCDANNVCAPGEVCVDGVCSPTGRECYGDAQCGEGYYCDFSTCWYDGNGDGESPDGADIACPGQCLPQQSSTCSDGTACPPGTHCEEYCTGLCEPCDCGDNEDCACPCDQECKSECVPNNTTGCQSDEECGPGYYCGGCDWMPNGIIACERQCLPTQGEICHYDYECGEGQRCDLIACDPTVPEPMPCDPASPDGACDPDEQRPVPVPVCWGYCVDTSPQCSTDSDCKEGEYCQIEWCTDSIPGTCGGTCQPKDPPGGECQSDWECVNAAGQQGYCQFVCEDNGADQERPCNPDDANCVPVDPTCRGYCEYPDPQTCSPNDPATCPAGTHCESSCDGWLPGALIACPWQCVPDEKRCESNCDCGYGETCKEGECVRVESFQCDDNWGCPDGYQCGCAFNGGFGIACYPQCIPERPACCSNSDCGDGSQCVEGECQAWTCWDGQCPDGYECQSQCPTPTPANGLIACPQVCVPAAKACQSDCDCPSTEACINGECRVADRMNECYPTGCQDDSQCATGEQCLIACPSCVPGAVCPPCFGTCVAQPGCSSDEECGPGQYCKLEWYDTCTADGSGFAPCDVIGRGICVDQPVVTPCNIDSDCQANEMCSCEPYPGCPQCDACQFQCVPKEPEPGECKEDADCRDGQVCNEYCPPCACPVNEDGTWGPCPWCECKGVCEEAPVDPGGCTSDSDCGPGQRCDVGICPAFVPCFDPNGEGCGGCTGQCVDDAPSDCMVTGCSGQVCADEPVFTTCEWREWYRCYQFAKCEEQASGSCGWTANEEFMRCLEESNGFDSSQPE